MQRSKLLGALLLAFSLIVSLSACGNSDSDLLMDGSVAPGAPASAVLVLAPWDGSGAALMAWGLSLESYRGAAVEVGFTGLDAAAESQGVQSALNAALALSALKPERVVVFTAVAYAGGLKARGMQTELAEATAALGAPATVIEGFGCQAFMQAYLQKRAARLCAAQRINLRQSILVVPLDEPLVAPAVTAELKKTFKDVRFVTSDRLLRLSLAARTRHGGRKLVVPYLTSPAQLGKFRLKTYDLLPGVLVDQATILEEPASLTVMADAGR